MPVPRPRKHKEGTYLTDGKRLIYVVRRVEEQPGQVLIEDVATNASVIVGDADLAGYRIVSREDKDEPEKSS